MCGKIPTKEKLEDRGINTGLIWVYGLKEQLDKVIEELKSKGINLIRKNIQTFPHNNQACTPEKVPIRARFDDINIRVIAKIAFNYLAKFQSIEFILNESFDPIRKYIRYGNPLPSEYIKLYNEPLLYEEFKNYQITIGHIVTVAWQGGPIVAKVKPFNRITYSIVLCEKYDGIFRNIQLGHHFDYLSHTITELHCIRHILIPGL